MTVAIVSVVSTAVLGIAGIIGTYWNAERQRGHEREQARAERLQEHVREAYVELLDLLLRMLGPARIPSEDERFRLVARATIIGSPELSAQMMVITDLYGAFVMSRKALDELETKGGDDAAKSELEKEMQVAREEFRAKVGALQNLMRAEVRED